MPLNYIKVNNTYQNSNKLKHLFEHAFPVEERPSFNMMMEFKNHEMYAIEENDTFIGLVDLVKYEDLMYVFFLALKKTYRHKGYGTKILSDMKSKYGNDYRIYLMAEDPYIECHNKDERNNRLKFYMKNGFKTNKETVIEFGVQYLILYFGDRVTKKDFLNTMKYFLGDKRYHSFYLKHVQ